MARDPLEELLRAEAERVTNDALHDSRQITHEQVDALAQLARLVEIRKGLSAPPPPVSRWSRWMAPLVLVATLIVVTLLLFTHVRRTEIELDVRLSEVHLKLASETVLAEGASLVGLSVTGAQEISVRRSGDWPGVELSALEGTTLSLEIPSAAPENPTSIGLSSITVSAGTEAGIQPGGESRHVRLLLKGGDIDIHATLLGAIRVAGSELQPQTVEFGLPRPAYFRGQDATISIELTASDDASIRFSPQLDVSGMSLYHVRHFEDSDRRLSSVISGSLYLEALNGSEEKLRAGQELRLKEMQGRIRTIELLAGLLRLQFYGHVGSMETGSYQNPRNLMPARLEWLRARHGISLLWGTAFYVFGLVSAALRWFSRAHAGI